MGAPSLSVRVWANILGGNAIYSDLQPGERFRFPSNAAGTPCIKLRGGWYAMGDYYARGDRKYRTGKGTAVVRLTINTPAAQDAAESDTTR